MKKLFAVLFASTTLFTGAAWEITAAAESMTETEVMSDSVILETRNGNGDMVEVEFPTDPQRLAVMDLGALDILDQLGYGDRITGVSKGSSIEYLQNYMTDEELFNLGTVKEVDMEALLECEPDVIFIGGRLSSVYDELAEIAPVYMIYTDTEAGVVESTKANAEKIASLFGAEDTADHIFTEYADRIEALQEAAEGKNAVVGMVNAGGFSLLGNDGRCSIIGREIGFENIGMNAEENTSSHGNEASFEFLLEKNPDYIFVLDRDAAIGTEGAQLAAEVMDNELVNMTDAAANGTIVILEHSNVWYTAEGGVNALGIMLADLEGALLEDK